MLSIIQFVTRAVIVSVRSFYLLLTQSTRLVKLKLSKLADTVYFEPFHGAHPMNGEMNRTFLKECNERSTRVASMKFDTEQLALFNE